MKIFVNLHKDENHDRAQGTSMQGKDSKGRLGRSDYIRYNKSILHNFHS